METKKHAPNEMGEALFIVNRHTKTAPDPSKLYHLKKEAIQKLLKEGKATKIGLHYSNNPRHSKQHSVLLIQIGNFYFHIPPDKHDLKTLPHLGKLDESYQNPKSRLSLRQAKTILYRYLNWSLTKQQNNQDNYMTSNLSPFYHKRKW
ncbi:MULTISPECIES: YkyB family protein [Gracilibacillus]|uniref:YkyB family protein n=1 Tax=Gracilibacillus TaxID=74385 RepID=UPI00082513DC|nr:MULTISPECIES: YkyB family protein [Gracilibacillus]